MTAVTHVRVVLGFLNYTGVLEQLYKSLCPCQWLRLLSKRILQTVFKSVKSGPFQIPYTGKPKIEVHVYQSIFLAPEALILC